MELRHLRYFVAVAEETSFTRAAQRLHVAQPALSVQIRRLEQDLGVELFDRSRRTIRLTEAGALLLTEARRILALVDETVDVVRRTDAGAVGSLSIGFVPSAANAALPPILRRFAAGHPGVVLHLREMAPDDLVRSLHEGRLDVCFLYLPFDDPSLEHTVVSREPFVAALPEGHPLAARKTIHVRALRDESFILPARHGMPGLHAQVVEICASAGFTPDAVQESVWLVQTIVGLVAAEVGVALVPSSAEALSRRGVAYRPLRGHTPHEVALAALWRRQDRPAVLRAFVEQLVAPSQSP
jgi:DNA-binding transcriptional LysR family regulator